jgi:hypothetical protein
MPTLQQIKASGHLRRLITACFRLVGNAHPTADQGFWPFAEVGYGLFQ